MAKVLPFFLLCPKTCDPKSKKSVDRFRLMWDDVFYQPGELKVVVYKGGEKIGENRLKTAGPPHRLRLTPDRQTIRASGEDLSYILIEALDKDGNLCPLADNTIELKIEGAGELAAVGNGNPQSLNAFLSNHVDLFYGKAMLIIKSGWKAGKINVLARSEKLKKGSVKVEVVQ